MEPQIRPSISQRKLEFWKEHLQRQQASKLSQVAYCQREGLTVSNFHHWKRRLKDQTDSSPRLKFIPIGPTDESVSAKLSSEPRAWLRLSVQDVLLEVPEDIDLIRLKGILAILRGGM